VKAEQIPPETELANLSLIALTFQGRLIVI
jgi:hypothetical protein